MNTFLKQSLILCFLTVNLFACQSGLQIVGQEHALVVKKWQELAQYIDKSTTNNPFTIVGRLSVDTQAEIQTFILTDIHLTQQETKFELNLIRPTFQNKYICIPTCLQLTEYFSDSQKNSTMLNRYFEQHEFELFKFYAFLVLQDDNISALYELSPIVATQYFNWLMQEEQKFNDLASISQFLSLALTQQSMLDFLNDPDKFYGNLLAKSQNVLRGRRLSDGISPPTEDEVLNTLNAFRKQDRLQNWLNIKDYPLEIGDQVCSYTQNEFGTVNGIIGNQVQVRIVGKLMKFVDGMEVSADSGDIYDKQLGQLFIPINRVEIYKADSIALCQLDL